MSSKKISPTLESLNTFFKTLGFVAFYAAIIPFVITWWFSGSLPQAIAMAFGFSILAIIFFCGTVKAQIMQSIVIPKFASVNLEANPNEYERLDLQKLEDYSQAIYSLGFMHLGDIALVPEAEGHGSGVARITYHPEHSCFAEIAQNFSPTDPNQDISMRCVFGSLMDKDWILSTSNIADLNGLVYMMHRPKNLWQRFPEYGIDAISDLLSKHFELRQEICNTLNLEVQTNLSIESYILHEENEGVSRHKIMEKKRILFALIEAYLFELNPKSEWLGDYTKFAAKSRVKSKKGNKSR
jgi:hypothetical protein